MDRTTITRNLRDGTVKFLDASTNSLSLAIDEGDFKSTESENTRNITDRGALDHIRTGDEEPSTFSVSVKFTQWYGAGATLQTLKELKDNPAALSWSSTAATGEPRTFTTLIETVDPGATAWVESYTLTRCRVNTLEFSEGDEYNTLALTGTAYITAGTVSSSSISAG